MCLEMHANKLFIDFERTTNKVLFLYSLIVIILIQSCIKCPKINS